VKKTIIHINQHVIRRNRVNGTTEPVITVKRGRVNLYANEVRIDGPCEVVYRPDAPLKCGARVWIETTSPVILDENALIK
jgi:hypothetical protein